MESMVDFKEASYKAHQDGRKFSGKSAELVMDKSTVDYWRHERMYSTLLPLLQHYPGASWITIGDGNFGKDANYLLSQGADATATDLNNPSYDLALELGFIRKFKIENAEHLTFGDDSFDFALVKEAFHHFPRPYIALYEMLRVAKKGVVLIEPNDQDTISLPDLNLKNGFFWFVRTLKKSLSRILRPSDKPALDYTLFYEPAGNFVFTLNYHELKKVAIALNYPAIAWKGFNDHYEEGAAEERLVDRGPLYQKIAAGIRRRDRQVSKGTNFPTMITFVIFKQQPAAATVSTLKAAGYVFEPLPRNPYIAN